MPLETITTDNKIDIEELKKNIKFPAKIEDVKEILGSEIRDVIDNVYTNNRKGKLYHLNHPEYPYAIIFDDDPLTVGALTEKDVETLD